MYDNSYPVYEDKYFYITIACAILIILLLCGTVIYGEIAKGNACKEKGMQLTNSGKYCYSDGKYYIIDGVGSFKFEVGTEAVSIVGGE